MLYCFAISDKGIRKRNEDCFLINQIVKNSGTAECEFNFPALVAVADGVGGEKSGEVASKMCLKKLADPKHIILSPIEIKCQDIHTILKKYGKSHHNAFNMQTTLSAIEISHNMTVQTVNVGDSRIYRFRNAQLKQLTKDQSLVQSLYDDGRINYEDKQKHKFKNIIPPVLGCTTAEPTIDLLSHGELQIGDLYLLCSDGLSDYVIASEIEEILAMPKSLKDRVNLLLDKAMKKGSKDNVTIAALLYS